jgi:hypothetical protein
MMDIASLAQALQEENPCSRAAAAVLKKQIGPIRPIGPISPMKPSGLSAGW